MAAWEFTAILSDVSGILRPDVTKVWESKDANGQSDWDRIKQLGGEGWEMVSCTPIAGGNGMVWQVLWTFKRPLNS